MKTITLNGFAGKIQIPDGCKVIHGGMTEKGDLVCPDYNFGNPRCFNEVKVGGVPVSRYVVALRPTKRVRWSKTRTFGIAPKRKTVKRKKVAKRKAKKGKKSTKRH